MKNGATIEFQGVSLRRGNTPALDDVSVTLSERRIGLIGPNGSGKSTFARLLNGLLTPDTGTVEVFGETPDLSDPARLGDVGFIFQNPDHQILFPTVEEELGFGLEQKGMRSAAARQEARAFLERHGVPDWAERPVHQLSEGQKHLVCLFAVLIMEPRLVVLDEPYASLDLATRMQLDAHISTLPQHVLLISHDLETLAGYERIVWLEDGRLRADGPAGLILPQYRVEMERAADLGRPDTVRDVRPVSAS